jgi:hypothetical protein
MGLNTFSLAQDGPTGYLRDASLSRLLLPPATMAALVRERDDDVREPAQPTSGGFRDPIISTKAPVTVGPKPAGRKRRRNEVQIYQLDAIDNILDQVKRGLEGRGERPDMLKKTCARLTELGPFRKLGAPVRHWRSQLTSMRIEFPNGADVFDYLEAELTIAEHAAKPFQLAPFGLVGAPGMGKSVLVEAIAAFLGSPLHRIQVEISGHASSLIGTAQHWSNSGPGLLFNALAFGQHANPIVLLDEIEKAPKRDDYPSLHDTLFGLLESASARNFRDASMPDLPIDASHVNWIGTANSLASIPGAIQSRMRFFVVPSLSEAQALSVLQSIDLAIRRDLRLESWEPMAADARAFLAKQSPRRMRLLLRGAYGNALVHGRRRLALNDVPRDLANQEHAASSSRDEQKQFEELLVMTNFAALRSIELNRRLAHAERVWAYAESHSPTLH